MQCQQKLFNQIQMAAKFVEFLLWEMQEPKFPIWREHQNQKEIFKHTVELMWLRKKQRLFIVAIVQRFHKLHGMAWNGTRKLGLNSARTRSVPSQVEKPNMAASIGSLTKLMWRFQVHPLQGGCHCSWKLKSSNFGLRFTMIPAKDSKQRQNLWKGRCLHAYVLK